MSFWGSESSEAEPWPDQTFDAPMVLLDNIIQIFPWPETRRRHSPPALFISATALDGGVLVHRDRARIYGGGCASAFGRTASPPPHRAVSQQEVDRLAEAVYRPTQKVERPFTLIRSRPPARSRCLSADAAGPASPASRHGLHRAQHRSVVDRDAAVDDHQFEIAIADGKDQIPTKCPQDHLAGELPPLEAVARIDRPLRRIEPGPYTGISATG